MTVDELIVKIQADTKDLRKKLGETNKHLNKIDKNSKQPLCPSNSDRAAKVVGVV